MQNTDPRQRRDRGLRRTTALTAGLVAAALAGSLAVATVAWATPEDTTTTTESTTSTSTDNTTSTDNGITADPGGRSDATSGGS